MSRSSFLSNFSVVCALLFFLPAHAPHLGIFLHGLGGNSSHACVYEKMLATKFFAPNFPDASVNGGFDSSKSCLAQEDDIAVVQSEREQHAEDLLLYGISRGASTGLNALALYGIDGLRGAIVESPFHHVCSVVKNFVRGYVGSLAFLPCITWAAHLFVPFMYGRYKRNGIQPINVAHKIPKDFPILFVCSKEDELIPWQSTYALYKRLRELGHEHVYILILERGRHAQLFVQTYDGDVFDVNGGRYRDVAHSFCRRYSMLHDVACAQRGEASLDECQPDVKEEISTQKSRCFC